MIVLVTTLGAGMVHLAAARSAISSPWPLLRVVGMVAVAWLVILAVFHTRSAGIMGSGATEYKRVAHASGFAFGILAIVFIVFQLPGIRMELIVALPLGLLALLASRWSSRRWLTTQRRDGHYSARTIVTGKQDDVEYVIRSLQSNRSLGYLIVGAATTDPRDVGDDRGWASLPDRGHTERGRHPRRGDWSADSIVVASRPDGDPDYVKRLSWQLEGTRRRTRALEPADGCRGARASRCDRSTASP